MKNLVIVESPAKCKKIQSYLGKDYKNFFIKKLLENLKIYNQVVVIKYINNKNPYNKK